MLLHAPFSALLPPQRLHFSIAVSTFWQISTALGSASWASFFIAGKNRWAFFDVGKASLRNPSIPCNNFQSPNSEPIALSSQLAGSLRYNSIPRTKIGLNDSFSWM